MKKRIFIMLLLLALAGLYAMTATAKGRDLNSGPTQTAQPTRPATSTAAAVTCEIHTGVEGGTVNLRRCGGVACEVLDILTEGERLTILTAGNWTRATTEDGVTGWLNSKYCKGQ